MARLILVSLLFLSATIACSDVEPGPTPTPVPWRSFSEWKDRAQEIPYDELFRYAEKHTGKIVYFRGEVVQVLEKDRDYDLRVQVTPTNWGWSDVVYVMYDNAPKRVLEGDIVAFVGRMNGLYSYKAIMGNKVTVPDIIAYSLVIEDE